MSKLKEAIELLNELPVCSLLEEVQTLLYCKELMLSQLPFKAGDQIRLTHTPEITPETAPGWLPYKHLLVEGRRGFVEEVFVTPGYMAYITRFEDVNGSMHAFYLNADMLELAEPETPIPTDMIEDMGQIVIDQIVQGDLVDAPEGKLIVWSGRAPYVLGETLLKFAKKVQKDAISQKHD